MFEAALLMRSVFHISYLERHPSHSFVASGSNVCNKSVMINFTCQHDLGHGLSKRAELKPYPLGVSVRMFLGRD